MLSVYLFWCIVRFSSFDFFVVVFIFILCLRVWVCFVFSSLYRSLNILFVFVLLITGCFACALIFTQQKWFFFLCGFLFFICGWCLFLWPLLVHCLCLCVGCVGYSFSLCAFLKYLDQRVGFFTAFQWFFFLLRVQEFKSFVFLFCFSFVLIFPPSSLSLFLCYFCFNLSGCLFSLKLTC